MEAVFHFYLGGVAVIPIPQVPFWQTHRGATQALGVNPVVGPKLKVLEIC